MPELDSKGAVDVLYGVSRKAPVDGETHDDCKRIAEFLLARLNRLEELEQQSEVKKTAPDKKTGKSKKESAPKNGN